MVRKFEIKSYYKSELAHMYRPNVEIKSALKVLNLWIANNAELYSALLATGYVVTTQVLTPKQVGLIVDYLGEP